MSTAHLLFNSSLEFSIKCLKGSLFLRYPRLDQHPEQPPEDLPIYKSRVTRGFLTWQELKCTIPCKDIKDIDVPGELLRCIFLTSTTLVLQGVGGERERYDNEEVQIVTVEIGDNFRILSNG
jgi:hypothetical protein